MIKVVSVILVFVIVVAIILVIVVGPASNCQTQQEKNDIAFRDIQKDKNVVFRIKDKTIAIRCFPPNSKQDNITWFVKLETDDGTKMVDTVDRENDCFGLVELTDKNTTADSSMTTKVESLIAIVFSNQLVVSIALFPPLTGNINDILSSIVGEFQAKLSKNDTRQIRFFTGPSKDRQ